MSVSLLIFSLLSACGGSSSAPELTQTLSSSQTPAPGQVLTSSQPATTNNASTVTVTTPVASQSTVAENFVSYALRPQVFASDLAQDYPQSTASNLVIPKGLSSIVTIEYQGKFKVQAGGDSGPSHAVGVIAYNPDNDSLYLAGHAHHNAVAEFQIPSHLSISDTLADAPFAPVLQDFVSVLDKKTHGNNTNKVTGMLYYQGCLIINSEIAYDAPATNQDNTQIFYDAHSLRTSAYGGLFQIEQAAKAAGYMSYVPSHWQERLGGEYLVGWASNYAIVSRYSVGPSLHVFDPQDIVNADTEVNYSIPVSTHMMYSLSNPIVPNANDDILDVSPIWGVIAKARYAFIIPNTDYLFVLGSHGGVNSGTGYKITQNNGAVCSGSCPYDASDYYNYFWLFDMNDILEAETPHSIMPVSYGKWSHPFDDNGQHKLIGATFDHDNDRLFVALDEAGQVGLYDAVPLILSYKITAKPSPN